MLTERRHGRGESPRRRTRRRRGAVLLEVVFAIALLVVTAVFILDGLSSATRATFRARLGADAADLGVSVLSEIQLGTLPMTDGGPFPFEVVGFEDWTYETVFEPLDDRVDLTELQRCEVIVRNDVEGYTHRVTQLIWNDPNRGAGAESDESTEAQPGGIDGGALPGGSPPAGGLP